jgi:hypothetical protein
VHFFKYVPLIDADFTITVGVDHVKTGAPFLQVGRDELIIRQW